MCFWRTDQVAAKPDHDAVFNKAMSNLTEHWKRRRSTPAISVHTNASSMPAAGKIYTAGLAARCELGVGDFSDAVPEGCDATCQGTIATARYNDITACSKSAGTRFWVS